MDFCAAVRIVDPLQLSCEVETYLDKGGSHGVRCIPRAPFRTVEAVVAAGPGVGKGGVDKALACYAVNEPGVIRILDCEATAGRPFDLREQSNVAVSC